MKKNIILIVFALLLLGGCKKDKEVQVVNIVEKNPTVTASVTSVTIREKYGYPGDLKSVTVAYTKNSDYSSASMIPAEIQDDYYDSYYHYYYVKLTNLEPNTKYYYYCIFDTGYGSAEGKQRSFTTPQNITSPTVTTNNVTDITQTTATCGGSVTSDGGAAVTARGVCWSTSQNPTVSNSHSTDGSGTGSFTSSITGLTASTTYYVRAYATNSAGTSYGEQESFTTQSGGGGTGDHEYVDLGLPSGLLWATCNVGADSPEGYGWYFMWGSVTEGGDPDCSWATCPGNGGSSGYNSSAIAAWDATHLTNNVLNPEVDAASVNWGGDWRMPTSAEWQELRANTTSTWTTEDGVYGRKFTSKTDSSKYIFLPVAGGRYGTAVTNAGSSGYYWSSSLNSSNPGYAYRMYFDSGNVNPQYCNYRYSGYTVRPVRVAR